MFFKIVLFLFLLVYFRTGPQLTLVEVNSSYVKSKNAFHSCFLRYVFNYKNMK